MQRILVGMSGGMDSAAVVLLLQQRGYLPVGCFVDMLGCGVQRAEVELLCARMGIECVVVDAAADFRRCVVERVIAAHNHAQTPSPCTICNPEQKFAALLRTARGMGIGRIATGHYINIEYRDGRHYVARGADSIKDQSYYLWNLGQELLAMLEVPLGGMHKAQVREFLAAAGYEHTAQKAESQGVCFTKSGYGRFIEENCELHHGDVVDTSGRVIGHHRGYQLYTIGQKRGFTLDAGIGAEIGAGIGNTPQPEVRAICPTTGTLTVGEPLHATTLLLENATYHPFSQTLPQTIMIRGLGRNPKLPISVSKIGNDRLKIELSAGDTAWAPAPGQPAVIYMGDTIIGGGIYTCSN